MTKRRPFNYGRKQHYPEADPGDRRRPHPGGSEAHHPAVHQADGARHQSRPSCCDDPGAVHPHHPVRPVVRPEAPGMHPDLLPGGYDDRRPARRGAEHPPGAGVPYSLQAELQRGGPVAERYGMSVPARIQGPH